MNKCTDVALVKHYSKSVSEFENLISCGVLSQTAATYLEKSKVSLEKLEKIAKTGSQNELISLLGGFPEAIETATRLRDFFLI